MFLSSGTSEHARSTETGQVTPFAGLLLDLNDNLTAYASYAEIFTPQGNYRSQAARRLPLVGKAMSWGSRANGSKDA